MDIAVIDLDGVVANSDERFARAATGGRVNWKIAFNPELVALDTLIRGADDSIRDLEKRGYTVQFLTSRPEAMRAATETWLAQHGLEAYELTMKPPASQFVKTVVWKADMVTEMIKKSESSHVLFIDDEEANRAAVQKAVEELGPTVVCLPSLEGCIQPRP